MYNFKLVPPHMSARSSLTAGKTFFFKCVDSLTLCAKSLQSHLTLPPCGLSRQASLSMGFSRQEYWSGLPFPPPGDLSDPGIKPVSLMSLALAGGFPCHLGSPSPTLV